MSLSHDNSVLDQESHFYLINLSFSITCFLNNAWILSGEVTCSSLLGVKRVKDTQYPQNRSLKNPRTHFDYQCDQDVSCFTGNYYHSRIFSKKIVLLHDRSLGYLNGVVIFYTANVVKSVGHVNLFRGTIGANSNRKKSNDCYLFAMRVLGQGRTNNCNSEVDILFGYTHWGLNTHYLRQKNIKKCLNLSTRIY